MYMECIGFIFLCILLFRPAVSEASVSFEYLITKTAVD